MVTELDIILADVAPGAFELYCITQNVSVELPPFIAMNRVDDGHNNRKVCNQLHPSKPSRT